VKRDAVVERGGKGNSRTDQDRHDRIADFAGGPEAQALAGDDAAAHEPDAAERRPQSLVDELNQIAGTELHAVAAPQQSRLVRTKVGVSPYVQANPRLSKASAVS
jgi:hypothetical protein